MANVNNVGMCVDFETVRNQGQQQVVVARQGWKITSIAEHVLRYNDNRYMVRSNFGNGDETDVIFPGDVTQMYDCPAGDNMNVNMAGGRKKRRSGKKSRKARKTRKSRKASKRTRRH